MQPTTTMAATQEDTSNDLLLQAAKLSTLTVTSTELCPITSVEDLHTKLTDILLPTLSANASISLPFDKIYKENVQRWSDHTATNPAAVVDIATEADICAAVRLLPTTSLASLLKNEFEKVENKTS